MADSVFISYARKDKEFVQRLATELDGLVDSGVWFDQSDIHAGDDWWNCIVNGIQGCKVFIFVISPNFIASKVAPQEISEAQKAGKTLIPVIYQTTKLPKDLESLVSKIQYIDLRRGSYADNFEYLVDALEVRGVTRRIKMAIPDGSEKRPFLRKPVKTKWGVVFSKIPGWSFAWATGWAIFWLALYLITLIFVNGRPDSQSSWEVILPTNVISGIFNKDLSPLIFPLSGFLGGAAGGLIAGLITMIVLRRYAPSIAWIHMAPSIRIWIIAGILGSISSILIIPSQVVKDTPINCSGAGIEDCFQQMVNSTATSCFSALFAILFIIILFFILVNIAWFITGIIAGWFAVRHIRSLEPGIRKGQAFWVMVGWGLGGVTATIITLVVLARITSS